MVYVVKHMIYAVKHLIYAVTHRNTYGLLRKTYCTHRKIQDNAIHYYVIDLTSFSSYVSPQTPGVTFVKENLRN